MVMMVVEMVVMVVMVLVVMVVMVVVTVGQLRSLRGALRTNVKGTAKVRGLGRQCRQSACVVWSGNAASLRAPMERKTYCKSWTPVGRRTWSSNAASSPSIERV